MWGETSVTLGFALLETPLLRSAIERFLSSWQPQALPPVVEEEPKYPAALGGFLLRAVLGAWWLAGLRLPGLLLGPAARYVEFGPVFDSLYAAMVAAVVAGVALGWLRLAHPRRARLVWWAALIADAFGLVVLYLLSRGSDWVVAREALAGVAGGARLLELANTLMRLGLWITLLVSAVAFLWRHVLSAAGKGLGWSRLGVATLSFLWLGAGAARAGEAQGPLSHHAAGVVEANEIRTAYESFGASTREAVLLIAGVGQQLVDWPPALVEELVRRGYRVVIFDNRDVGLSTRLTAAGVPDPALIGEAMQAGRVPSLPYTLRDMAADAVGLLDALGVHRAHIVGASMGGGIAQLVAIDHPRRALSLTTMMADSGNPALPVVAKPEAFAGLPPAPPAGDREAFIASQVETRQVLAGPRYPADRGRTREAVERGVRRSYDPEALLRQQTVAFVGHFDPGHRYAGLKSIQAPTVVLQGSDDPIVPVEAARDIAANVPGADLRIIEGLGHALPLPLVPRFADAIVAAARRSSPAGPR